MNLDVLHAVMALSSVCNKLLTKYFSHSKYVFQEKMHASVQDLGKYHHQMMLFL